MTNQKTSLKCGLRVVVLGQEHFQLLKVYSLNYLNQNQSLKIGSFWKSLTHPYHQRKLLKGPKIKHFACERDFSSSGNFLEFYYETF